MEGPYWKAMALFREALLRFSQARLASGLEERLKRDERLSRTARIFTAALNVAELANATNDPEESEYLAVAGNGLLLPLAYILSRLGPCPDLPQDVKKRIAAVLGDFELQAPALAHRLAQQLKTPALVAGTEIENSNGRVYV